MRATRTSSIPWLEISSQATSRMRSRPPPGRPRGRGVDAVGTATMLRAGATLDRRPCLGPRQTPMEDSMLRSLRSRLTYANVVSTIALALAVGGGSAYAASKIGTSDIRYHAVTGAKVATNAV